MKQTHHKSTTFTTDTALVQQLSLRFHGYLALLNLCVLAANIVFEQDYNITHLAMLSALFIYSIATLLLKDSRPDSQAYLCGVDGLITGLVISECGYCPNSSLALIGLLYFSTIYHGGLRFWLTAQPGLLLGLGLGFFALGNMSFVHHTPLVITLIVALVSIIYLCGYAWLSYHQLHMTEQHFSALSQEIVQHKLRIHEISRYLPKAAWQLIEKKKSSKIRRKPISIFFSDIIGFSSLTEELGAETLANILGNYLTEMTKIATEHSGTVDKFIGDAIMVTFGDNEEHATPVSVKRDALACVSMAIAMRKRMRELQPKWMEMGIKKPLQIRIGISSGYCTVGTFGTDQHLDHTALGVHVNLASRLESAGHAEEILISQETQNLIKDTILCKDRGSIQAKGFTHPVQVYEVVNHRKELGATQNYVSQVVSGFSVHADIEQIKNFDKKKIIHNLESIIEQLKD